MWQVAGGRGAETGTLRSVAAAACVCGTCKPCTTAAQAQIKSNMAPIFSRLTFN